MPRLPVYLDIDVSDAQELIKALRAAHSPENFSTIMRRAITRTGNHVKTIVAKDASKHYNITQRRIKQDIGNPQMLLESQSQLIADTKQGRANLR